MTKITGSFLILVSVIFFSSIVYIWKADAEKKDLETQIVFQEKQISYLETQLINITSPSNDINLGEVQGVAVTATGIVSGTVTLSEKSSSKAVLVCANETHTKQENCLDFIIQDNITNYKFEFEIPNGTYEVYAMIPPNQTKVYFSEISTCNEGSCKSNTEKKTFTRSYSR